MPSLTEPCQVERELLKAAGVSLPPTLRVEVGTRRARALAWIFTRLDAPPAAFALGRTVFIPDPAYFARLTLPQRAALLAHESVHVAQWQRLGAPRFLWQYLRDYLRTRRQGLDTHDPHQGIALEREALAYESRLLPLLEVAAGAEDAPPPAA